jgi:hypothetical protein
MQKPFAFLHVYKNIKYSFHIALKISNCDTSQSFAPINFGCEEIIITVYKVAFMLLFIPDKIDV